jgi:TRAP-type C4-dicarboxylate transport system permease small subunit
MHRHARRFAHGEGKTMEAFVRFNVALERWCAYAAGLCLFVFTTVVFIDVVYRQILKSPLLWPSEISVSLFVWSVMLGAAVCTRRQSHLAVEVLPTLSPRVDHILRVLVNILVLIFAVLIFWTGVKQAIAGINRFTPMMGFPLWPFLIALPIPALPMMLFSLEHLLVGSPPPPAPELDALEGIKS